MQEKRRRELALQNLQLAVTAGLPHLAVPQLGLPGPGPSSVRPQLQANSNMLMEGFQQNLLNQGALTTGLSLASCVRDCITCQLLMTQRQFHGGHATSVATSDCRKKLSPLFPYR